MVRLALLERVEESGLRARERVRALCEVTEGSIALGQKLRIVDPAGEIYRGAVQSLHIGPDAVGRAQRGQQVGLKIEDFQKARVGDWVEAYEPEPADGPAPWCPRGGVYPVSS